MALPTNLKLRPNLESKMRGNDRVFLVKPTDGSAKTGTGMVDKELFSGNNKLHAIYDENKQLWYLKYEKGVLPIPLQQSFTSFTMLLKIIKPYFEKRNITITEIVNA